MSMYEPKGCWHWGNFVKDGRICETGKSIVCLNQEFKEEEKEETMKSREGEEEEKCLKHTL